MISDGSGGQPAPYLQPYCTSIGMALRVTYTSEAASWRDSEHDARGSSPRCPIELVRLGPRRGTCTAAFSLTRLTVGVVDREDSPACLLTIVGGGRYSPPTPVSCT